MRFRGFGDWCGLHYNRHGEAFSQGETFSGVPFERALEFVNHIRDWAPPGMSMAQMAMRWILDYPAVSTVIAVATRPAQVLENTSVSNLDSLPAELHDKPGAFYRNTVKPAICVDI